MSAPRASDANPFPKRTVLLPGSPTTYEQRAVLRDLGLRWDPATHAWIGNLPGAGRAFLERAYGLRPQPVVPIEAFQVPAVAVAPPSSPRPPTGLRGPNVRDSSRTCAEARVVYRDGDEDAEEIATPTRWFSLLDITSGLPDDSLETEEREAERRLRDLRGRVKRARAVIAGTPGLADVLATDWRRAARFYARFGVTEQLARHGVAAAEVEGEVLADRIPSPMDWIVEMRDRAEAVLPGSGWDDE